MTIKAAYHHGNLRQALLDTAFLFIEEQGAEKLSLRALARSLGVSQAAPYRHFVDKTALLSAMASEGFHRLALAMKSAMGDIHADPVAAFQKGGQAYIRFAQQNPQIYRLMYGKPVAQFDSEEMANCHHEAFELLEQTLDAGFKQGVFKALDKQAIVLASWSLVHGYAQLVIDGIIDPGEKPADIQFQHLGVVFNQGVVATTGE